MYWLIRIYTHHIIMKHCASFSIGKTPLADTSITGRVCLCPFVSYMELDM